MLLIQNGRVLDPYTQMDALCDVLIGDDGVIAQVAEHIDAPAGCTVYDESGLTVSPGFVDGHVHFRDPGLTYKEDIQTGSAAAKKGGYTTVVTMANTKPPVDNVETVKYIIEEGTAVPFMIDLGVMTESGKIIRTRYDKYRQINRFLEFIEDILPELPTDRTVHIIDFGCGKSYLTFAMYYYLKVLKHYDIRITGLDLKQKVIEDCQALADRYGYDGLQFLCGDIADYNGTDEVDML